jgi:hypothetical protein
MRYAPEFQVRINEESVPAALRASTTSVSYQTGLEGADRVELSIANENLRWLDHPLLKLDNVVATYHTAGVSHEARRNVAAIAAEQIVGMLKGGRPPRLVNPEVWPAYAARFEKMMGLPVQHVEQTLE